MIRDILLLISLSCQNGVEGIVTNNLSEGLKGNGLNGVWAIGWVNLQSNGLDLINWHGGGLTLSIKWVSLGGDKVGLSWGSFLGVLLVVLLVVVLL